MVDQLRLLSEKRKYMFPNYTVFQIGMPFGKESLVGRNLTLLPTSTENWLIPLHLCTLPRGREDGVVSETYLIKVSPVRRLESDDSPCRKPGCCRWTWPPLLRALWIPQGRHPKFQRPSGKCRRDGRSECGCCLSPPRKCTPDRPPPHPCNANDLYIFRYFRNFVVIGLSFGEDPSRK